MESVFIVVEEVAVFAVVASPITGIAGCAPTAALSLWFVLMVCLYLAVIAYDLIKFWIGIV